MEKNLYLLPTDKPSRIIIYSTLLNEFRLLAEPIEDWKHKRNVYITNDEEIKDGDWCYDKVLNIVFQTDKHTNFAYVNLTNNVLKIILTTDPDLINNGVQAIDKKFLEWFVKNPTCESVGVTKEEVFSRCGPLDMLGSTHITYKIIIPEIITRCCGRCNGIDDLCFTDMTCDNHRERGCEICYGKRVEYLIDITKEEPSREITFEEVFGEEKKKGLKEFIDKHKKETLDEAVERLFNYHSNNTSLAEGHYDYMMDKEDFKQASYELVKWQQEQDKNKFSAEEVRRIAEWSFHFYKTNEFDDDELEAEWSRILDNNLKNK